MSGCRPTSQVATRRVNSPRALSRNTTHAASAATPAPIHRLQRAAGNRGMGRFLRGLIQPKLSVNRPGDRFEQEADRVADQVMRMPEPRLAGSIQRSPLRIQRQCGTCGHEHPSPPTDALQAPLQISRMCSECEKEHSDDSEESLVQAKRAGDRPEIPPDFESYLAGSRSGGQPLSDSARSYFEPRFGHDLRAVRVHADSQAARSASEIGASAYTVGQHIYFGAGQFSAGTADGGRLLAHELVHTIQQGHGQERNIQRTCNPGPVAAKVGARTGCTDQFDGVFVTGRLFRFNSECDTFASGQDTALVSFAAAQPPSTTFEIHGYASTDGPLGFNQDLGCARALEAQTLLAGAAPGGAGIAGGRITAVINHGPVPGPIADRRSVVITTSTPPPPPPPVPPPAPLTATCAAPTNPDLSGSAFNPTTSGETSTCVFNPLDCSDAFDCADVGFAAAAASGLPGAHLGPRDALRHCVWACCMTQKMGATEAEKFGTAHENSNPSPIPFDDAMDLHDNAVGRSLGTPGASCATDCASALSAGLLRSVRGPEADTSAAAEGLAPAAPSVPTTCIGPSDQPWP